MIAHSAVGDDPARDPWLRGYFCASEDWDRKEGMSASSRQVKNVDFLRLRDVALHLLRPAAGKKVLDVGCANGPTMVYCGLQGATVYGIDLDAAAVKYANQLLSRFNLQGEAVCGDATQLPFADNTFDGVISSDFIEHIDDAQKVAMFREALRVLKPGAIMVCKTPNLSYLRVSLLYKRLRAVARLQNPMKFVIPHTLGTKDPQHIGLTTRWGYTRCILDAGFLNYDFVYAPLRRFGRSAVVEIASTEIPVLRDFLCEDLFCRAYKPIVLSHFPD